ncbi:MAG: hypothetical protein LBR17_04365 [Bacteroidales bacterium]|jgi:hypothetical protein|nr:hypothetical protein [Bacteroidales bacterium]
MLKNIYKVLVIGLMVTNIGFISCADDEQIEVGTKHNNKNMQAKTSTRNVALDLMNAMIQDFSIANEINQSINMIVTEYDVDENLTYYDVLNTENSVFFHNSSMFPKLKEAINVSTLTALGLNSENHYDNLNIYWGYRDDWDGETFPIICYIDGDEDESTEVLNGFKYENGQIINVQVTQEQFDASLFPVIIINFNEIDYIKYPDFKNGIRIKNGIKWLKGTKEVPNEDPEPPVTEWTNPNKIYTSVFRAVKSGGIQYDTWVAGGSEFKVLSGFIETSTLGDYTEYSTTFTRKEIGNHSIKYYEYPILNPDWKPNQEEMVFYMIEEDGGFSAPYTASLKVSSYVTLEISIPQESWDDEVGAKCKVTRELYFARWLQHIFWYSFGDCELSVGLQIYDRPY